jgi:predicted alpha/beta-hydrolase family hydrolase
LPVVSPAVISTVAVASDAVSCVTEGPDDADVTVVLAHGAGGDMTGEFIATVSAGLMEEGMRVVRFNFPYAERGRRAPDRQEVLEATWRAVLDAVHQAHAPPMLIAGGKSMGGRIASQVVAAGARVTGLVFLGYPLHPPGKPDRVRAEHLRDVSVPMLFVEGTRDPFCPPAALERVLAGLSVDVQVVTVPEGDHSFRVPRASGRATAEAWAEIAPAVAAWARAIPR